MRRRILATVAGAAALALAVFGPGVAMSRADDAGPDGLISGQVDSYAMRVEYDIPLPAGSGTVAHVIGEVRRSQAGENAKGLAGAPSALDAVVSGKYVDPRGTGKPERKLPQTECFYPGSLVDTKFLFPTDTQAETAGAPAIAYATSQCMAGPSLELHAVDDAIGAPNTPTAAMAPAVTAGHVASAATSRPIKSVLDTVGESHASNVSAFGGALTIGSVNAISHSSTDGHKGGAHSRTDVSLNDIAIAGLHFSLSSSTVDGKDQAIFTIAGQSFPADSSAGAALLASANAALNQVVQAAGGSGGCDISVVTSPTTYPQGSLFRRDPPEIGVAPDGSLAASYRGGLLVVCDVPRSVSEPTTISPQRAQVLFGFAFTSTAAKAEIGGFGFGDLVTGPPLAGVNGSTLSAAGPALDTVATPSLETGSASIAPSLTPRRSQPRLVVAHFHMDAADRWLLGILGLLGWLALTRAGVRRFVVATTPCDNGEDAG